MEELMNTIKDLVIPGKGILAADESVKTATKRLDSIGVVSSEETRRQYRNLILTAPGIEKYISGVIFYEETLSQKTDQGILFPQHLSKLGVVPGIKVDLGLNETDNGEKLTKGLAGLGDRLDKYKKAGCRFAKWRAVYSISENTPSSSVIKTNAEGLAKYAKICQEHGFVPIVEPEVLIDGQHSIDISYEATKKVQMAVFQELIKEKVSLSNLLLKPSMVISGKNAQVRAGIDEVAKQTINCLKSTVPQEVPSINFLSGGQSPEEATAHLNAMHNLGEKLPWNVSFSYARALQEPALNAWKGKKENLEAGQNAFLKRARLNCFAALGRYSKEMEDQD
jgi:fructose-bisphosphate aldolase, class I